MCKLLLPRLFNFTLFLCALLPLLSAEAQEETKLADPSYVMSFGQDNRFGFYPSVVAYLPQTPEYDLTFYSLFWTIPSYTSGKNNGEDLFTEFGAGINFHLLDGKLSVNPQLGLGNGSALSGASTGVVGDGIIPALFVNYADENFEYGGWLMWYRHLRNEGRTIDYTWWGSLAGVKLCENWTSGLMYDQYETTHNSEGPEGTYYQWIGPYVGLFIPQHNAQIRFAAGWDTSKAAGYTDFYKATFSIGF